MKLCGIALVLTACTLAAAPSLAQQVASPDPKPVIQMKPAAWAPKVVHRSQLRPQLKPVPVAAAQVDVYVPAAQTPLIRTATAAGAPVQLAATQPAGQTMGGPNGVATVQDFVGRFLGAGVEVALEPSPSEPPRRMSQVEIAGDANEFTVKWATMQIGANFKAETVKSSQQELTFRPSPVAGRYLAVPSPSQSSPPDATAEIKGRTMVVTVTTPLPSGVKSIQRYERTLTDQGMNVVFTRTESGKLVRQVNLTLSRSGGSIWRNL